MNCERKILRAEVCASDPAAHFGCSISTAREQPRQHGYSWGEDFRFCQAAIRAKLQWLGMDDNNIPDHSP